MNEARFFVLTGGPGAGKTTLIEALERAGHGRSFEAGRAIIRHQVLIGGTALPWEDRRLFADLMLSWDMRSHGAASTDHGFVFFDRGVPDVAGYLTLCGLPIPPHVTKAATVFRYNRAFFLLPPWQAIFRQDKERKQDFDEAVRTFDAVKTTYESFGYDPIEVLCLSVEDRVGFVLDAIAHFEKSSPIMR